MKKLLFIAFFLPAALLAQSTRVISEGSGSNQDLEYDPATGILSITNGLPDTIEVMAGATSGTDGVARAPEPLAGQESLFLRGDGTYANPSTGGDNWGSQVVQSTARLSGDGTSGNQLDLAQQGATSGQVLKWTGSAWGPDDDTDTNTDSQTLGLAANSLSITGGNSVSLAPYLDNTDEQDLGLAGSTLSITGGNSVNLSAFLDNTDGQTLTFTESTRALAISGGNSVDLSEGIQEEVNAVIVARAGISKTYNDGGNSITISSTVVDTDDQTLSLAGTLLTISDGNSQDLAGINTDGETLGLAANTLSISGGNGVSLAAYLDNTDSQTLGLAGSTLSVSGGNSVSLAAFLDNTDGQTLTFTESTRALAISGGNSADLSEGIQEEVNALIVAGTGITKTYNDGANTLTLAASSTGDNIYNTDGSLTEGRVVDTAGFELEIVTQNVATAQRGLVLRSGYSQELASHYPLTIAAGTGGADSIYFVSTDTNLGIGTNTNGMKYAQANTFTNPLHIVDKAYVDAAVSGVPSVSEMDYIEVGSSSPSTRTINTSFSKFTHLTTGEQSLSGLTWNTTTDRFTYIGDTKVAIIHFEASVSIASTFNEVTFVIQENGSDTRALATIETSSGGQDFSISGVALVTLNSGDTFEFGNRSQFGTPQVTVGDCNIVFYSLN